VAASLYFLLLFIHLSIAADSFFSKNIASIVDLHKISQNIAGITFMVGFC
jgi:Ca2+/Na+ antiporter